MKCYGALAVLTAAALTSLLAACEQPTQGGQVRSLEGTSWKVEKTAGLDVPARIDVTIAFRADGRVAGSTGCNRYFTTYKSSGGKLEIGLVGSTKMMCPSAQTEAEQRFLAALGTVKGWQSEGGNMVLTTAAGETALRLKPIK